MRLYRHPSYAEVTAAIDDNSKIRLPDRRATQWFETAAVQQLRDSFESAAERQRLVADQHQGQQFARDFVGDGGPGLLSGLSASEVRGVVGEVIRGERATTRRELEAAIRSAGVNVHQSTGRQTTDTTSAAAAAERVDSSLSPAVPTPSPRTFATAQRSLQHQAAQQESAALHHAAQVETAAEDVAMRQATRESVGARVAGALRRGLGLASEAVQREAAKRQRQLSLETPVGQPESFGPMEGVEGGSRRREASTLLEGEKRRRRVFAVADRVFESQRPAGSAAAGAAAYEHADAAAPGEVEIDRPTLWKHFKAKFRNDEARFNVFYEHYRSRFATYQTPPSRRAPSHSPTESAGSRSRSPRAPPQPTASESAALVELRHPGVPGRERSPQSQALSVRAARSRSPPGSSTTAIFGRPPRPAGTIVPSPSLSYGPLVASIREGEASLPSPPPRRNRSPPPAIVEAPIEAPRRNRSPPPKKPRVPETQITLLRPPPRPGPKSLPAPPPEGQLALVPVERRRMKTRSPPR
jgi:hypothetical protein